ncbi:hypothetical protein ACN27G_29375 [Plantactinospora sp. WMMB334]|uniref:hypothetical protein n=1 Tax=Plantactinospora sp. WMMB334 TaxID=3404119 RepID=UPI003B93A556
MSPDCLVGVLDPDQSETVRVRYVHLDGSPGHVLPTLDRIWSHTCSHDTTALVDGLLAHHWSYLDGDVSADTAITLTGEQPVPGIGMASESDDSQAEVLPMQAAVDRVSWVYVIDSVHATVTVHDQGDLGRPLTRHHLTDPAQQASRTEEPLPADPAAAVRGAGGTHGRALADAWAQDALDSARADARVTPTNPRRPTPTSRPPTDPSQQDNPERTSNDSPASTPAYASPPRCSPRSTAGPASPPCWPTP